MLYHDHYADGDHLICNELLANTPLMSSFSWTVRDEVAGLVEEHMRASDIDLGRLMK